MLNIFVEKFGGKFVWKMCGKFVWIIGVIGWVRKLCGQLCKKKSWQDKGWQFCGQTVLENCVEKYMEQQRKNHVHKLGGKLGENLLLSNWVES